MTMIKKDKVIAGLQVEVIYDGQRGYTSNFILNAYAMLTNPSSQRLIAKGECITVLTKPTRSIDGINLVKVKMSDGTEGAVFYTDLVNRCQELPIK